MREQSDIRWYFKGQSKSDVQNLLTQVPYFLHYFINKNDNNAIYFKFARFLKETFKDDENELENILKQKIKYFNGLQLVSALLTKNEINT